MNIDFHKQYDDLISALEDLDKEERRYHEIKFKVEMAQASLISDGVHGKNAEERAANLALQTADLLQSLHLAELGYKQAKNRYQVCKLEVDKSKAIFEQEKLNAEVIRLKES